MSGSSRPRMASDGDRTLSPRSVAIPVQITLANSPYDDGAEVTPLPDVTLSQGYPQQQSEHYFIANGTEPIQATLVAPKSDQSLQSQSMHPLRVAAPPPSVQYIPGYDDACQNTQTTIATLAPDDQLQRPQSPAPFHWPTPRIGTPQTSEFPLSAPLSRRPSCPTPPIVKYESTPRSQIDSQATILEELRAEVNRKRTQAQYLSDQAVQAQGHCRALELELHALRRREQKRQGSNKETPLWNLEAISSNMEEVNRKQLEEIGLEKDMNLKLLREENANLSEQLDVLREQWKRHLNQERASVYQLQEEQMKSITEKKDSEISQLEANNAAERNRLLDSRDADIQMLLQNHDLEVVQLREILKLQESKIAKMTDSHQAAIQQVQEEQNLDIQKLQRELQGYERKFAEAQVSNRREVEDLLFQMKETQDAYELKLREVQEQLCEVEARAEVSVPSSNIVKVETSYPPSQRWASSCNEVEASYPPSQRWGSSTSYSRATATRTFHHATQTPDFRGLPRTSDRSWSGSRYGPEAPATNGAVHGLSEISIPEAPKPKVADEPSSAAGQNSSDTYFWEFLNSRNTSPQYESFQPAPNSDIQQRSVQTPPHPAMVQPSRQALPQPVQEASSDQPFEFLFTWGGRQLN